MGFLKNLFASKPNPQEEEPIDDWSAVSEIPDIHERMRRMEKLANAGDGVACICMHDDYLNLATEYHQEVQWDKLEYWAKKAIENDAPRGHLYLGMLYSSPNHPEPDLAEGAAEFLLALEWGMETAGEQLQMFWNYHNPKASEEECSEVREMFRDMIVEGMQPEMERLQADYTEKTYCAFGFLYYYGVYFEQDMEAAKECFKNLAAFGNSVGKRMLENPIFEDDEDDE